MAMLKQDARDTTRLLREKNAKHESDIVKLKASLARAREETKKHQATGKKQATRVVKRDEKTERKWIDEVTKLKKQLEKERKKTTELALKLTYFTDAGDIVDMDSPPRGRSDTTNKRGRPTMGFLEVADTHHRAHATFLTDKEVTEEREVTTWIDAAGYIEIQCSASPEISLIRERLKPFWDDEKIGRYIKISDNSYIYVEPIHNDQ